jgi:hypothetical protein
MPTTSKTEEKEKCFVIMPISDPDGYAQGHFRKVYEQIFTPAIEKAGYAPHRVDYDKSSHLIHASIIHELIDAPMVLCDLSTRNPNVLYELGIRHAYGKPVVLVQEIGTERIFDINGIMTAEYHRGRIFDEVLLDQEQLFDAIVATKSNKKNYSLSQLIHIPSATIVDEKVSEQDRISFILESIQTELRMLKRNMYRLTNRSDNEINKDRVDLEEMAQNLTEREIYRNYIANNPKILNDKEKKILYRIVDGRKIFTEPEYSQLNGKTPDIR